MKRVLVLVLLVPILALTMISCDADMRSNIANLMDGFGGNVYEDAGFIVANTAQAEAAAVIVAAIGTDAEDADADGFGVTIPAPAVGTKVLAPQSEAEQTVLKDNLGDAFNSDTQKEQLLEELKKPVTDPTQIAAAQGTVEVFNATLDALKTQLGSGDTELGKTLEKLKLPVIASGDDLTHGDMLALQLMTDLISNTVATLTEIGGTLAGATDAALGDPANKDKVLSIIDDALFAAEVAEQISGAASIDFTGLLVDDLEGLLNRGARGTRAVETIALTDAEDFIGTINALAPTIVELMGITYDGTNFIYTNAKYKSFLLNQQIYRSSMEQALKMMELGNIAKSDMDNLNFDTSTLVKYALSVFITEHHAFWESEEASDATATDPNVIIALYLNDSAGNKKLGLGTLTKDDVLTQPTGITGFDYANWPTFLKNNSLDYYKAIINNIIRINDAAGITAELSTELIKFRDAASTEDGLTKWYNEL
ncbi:MAG: hypothetical protein JEY71_14705 [Sphaerochaeta sp.]|nr:hypothetical protein [Sphaerochaeta sp.]